MEDLSGLAYDIAVSFASEHRDYVARTVDAAKSLGLRVFYDSDMTNDFWGSNRILEKHKVFGAKTRYFVPFISNEYLSDAVPMDDFSVAMMTAVTRGDTYILPVLIGGVRVPHEFLHPQTGCLKAEDYTPGELAQQLDIKVRKAKGIAQEPRDVRVVVEKVKPVVLPHDFKYREVEATFGYLAEQFMVVESNFTKEGFVCSIKYVDQQRVAVRIERNNLTVYSLDISIGERGLGWDRIAFGPGRRMDDGGGITAWAEPYYDRSVSRAKLKVRNIALLPTMADEWYTLAKEELFQLLYEEISALLERQ
jgi:hypothetical protein